MATKPTALPIWATDGTNNTEPTLTQKQTGWTTGQDGVSDYDNWYKELVWQWCSYVNDGILTDIEIDDLHVTGTLTVDGLSIFNDTVGIADHIDLAPAAFIGYSAVQHISIEPGRRFDFRTSVGTGSKVTPDANGFSYYTLSDELGKAFADLHELKPGCRIKAITMGISAAGGGSAGSPIVSIVHRGIAYSIFLLTNGGTNSGTSVSVGVGGRDYWRWDVDVPTAVGIQDNAASGTKCAMRPSIFVTAGAGGASIFSVDIEYDVATTPAVVV